MLEGKALLELSLVHCRSSLSTTPSSAHPRSVASLASPDDPQDHLSQLLAILTLSPILIIPAYLAVLVFEREASVLSMLAGQVREHLTAVLHLLSP